MSKQTWASSPLPPHLVRPVVWQYGGMIGVILAGGASTRMGTDKAFVEIAGRPMFEWVGQALEAVVGRVIVAGRSEALDQYEAVPDIGEPHRGPLGGLFAAANAHPEDPLLVVAVDQPWVRADTLRSIRRAFTELAVEPVDGGARQVLCAAYPSGLADLGAQELTNRGSIKSLIDVTSFEPISDIEGEDGRSWYSADTPAAIEIGLKRFGPPGSL